MEVNGAFIASMLVCFVLPYLVAIIIFGRVKKYSIVKLFLGLTALWILISALSAGIVYLITDGSINTKSGAESSFGLSVIWGVLIGWMVALLGGLTVIEKVGINGAESLAKEILRNREQILIIRLLQALCVSLFGLPIKLIYKWAKKNKI